MAGVKGKSGGARTNSGGKRPGAGRKKTVAVVTPEKSTNAADAKSHAQERPAELSDFDMLGMLQAVALGQVMATALQVRAAIAAVQYTHTKRSDGGKKDDVENKAKQAAGGKFGARPAPLKLVNGG